MSLRAPRAPAVPFVVVPALSRLKSFDLRQEQVARSLGAPRISAFMRVTSMQASTYLIGTAEAEDSAFLWSKTVSILDQS
jgi:ABC-type spermidine/putrescine transport system permease subunit II